jgi:ribulose-phosphate 3-epimerase
VVHIAPSILAADFSRLGEQVAEAERAGAQRIHVDVMDGHFVPNLTMGACVVQSLRPRTRLPLEVHMMVDDPGRYLDGFIKAGADGFIVHHEVLADPRPTFLRIRQAGKKVGFAVNPNHPVDVLAPYLGEIDLALCMTVFPGFGGQAFLPESPDRIRRLRQLIDQHNPRCELEVDGGVDVHTAPAAVTAGANVLVIGTGIFHYKEGAAAAIQALRARFPD